MGTIIQVNELLLHLKQEPEAWSLADCRHSLASSEQGEIEFKNSHLPGAQHFHLDKDLSGEKNGRNGRHPLPLAADFFALLQKRNMRKNIVAYDASDGIFAARFWWLCRWIGWENVFVLDGGWQAWQKAAPEITIPQNLPTLSHEVVPGHSDHGFSPVNSQTILNNLQEKLFLVMDARSPERFRGEGETLDPVGGHIPMAANRFYKNNLTETGCFKDANTLKIEFEKILEKYPAQRVVHQCGSGVTACHNLLAMEIAGLSGSLLYPGSWSEWCSNPLRPIAK